MFFKKIKNQNTPLSFHELTLSFDIQIATITTTITIIDLKFNN